MGLFLSNKQPDDSRQKELLTEIQGLRTQLAELLGERKAVKEELSLSKDIVALKQEKVNLEIQLDRVKEEHEREKRDIKHMVGLEKKRQEFEIESARRETTLSLREENLKADQARFEQEMEFTRDRFTEEVGYLKDMHRELLERLPKVDVSQRFDIVHGERKRAVGDE